jgi:hypothetical protein
MAFWVADKMESVIAGPSRLHVGLAVVSGL